MRNARRGEGEEGIERRTEGTEDEQGDPCEGAFALKIYPETRRDEASAPLSREIYTTAAWRVGKLYFLSTYA